jgi:hypothetical protein
LSQTESIPLTFKEKQPEHNQNPIYYVDKVKAAEYEKYGLKVEPNLLDIELTDLMTQAEPNSITYQFEYMLRESVSGHEYLRGLMSVTGTDSGGNTLRIVSNVPFGTHQEISPNSITKDDKGNILYVNPTPELITKYDIPWDKKQCESMIQETNTDTSKMQFAIVQSNGKRLSVGSYMEFVNLSYNELLTRGLMGYTGYPLDVSFSSMTGVQKLELQQLKRKGANKI